MTTYGDTCLIPWPTFILKGMVRRKDFGFIVIFGGLLAGGGGGYGTHALISQDLAVMIGVVSLGLWVVVVGMLADPLLTRPAVVYRADAAGEAFEDHQRWWTSDWLTWPDTHKRSFNGKRVLWIDALDEKKPVPFDPWLAPLPTSDGNRLPVTASRVAAVKAKSKAVAKIGKHRQAAPGEKLQQGLIIGAIIASFLAIVMAGNNVAELMGVN